MTPYQIRTIHAKKDKFLIVKPIKIDSDTTLTLTGSLSEFRTVELHLFAKYGTKEQCDVMDDEDLGLITPDETLKFINEQKEFITKELTKLQSSIINSMQRKKIRKGNIFFICDETTISISAPLYKNTTEIFFSENVTDFVTLGWVPFFTFQTKNNLKVKHNNNTIFSLSSPNISGTVFIDAYYNLGIGVQNEHN